MRYLLLLFAVGIPAYSQFGPASAVVSGPGAPVAAQCTNANNVGRVWARKDGAAANATFYVCANTGIGVYEWELLGSGGGGGGGGAIVSPFYSTTVVGQTTLTVAAATHGQGATKALTIGCMDGSGTPWIAADCEYTISSAGEVVFTWSPAFTGSIVIAGGGAYTPFYSATVVAQTTLTVPALTHGRGDTQALVVGCRTGASTPWTAVACSYTISNGGTVVFTWAPAFTGEIVIGGGPIVTTAPVAISALPTCNSGAAGTTGSVNNALMPAIGSPVAGSGAAFAFVVCNGTDWMVSVI